MDMNTDLEASVDVMFINRMNFLVRANKRLKFTTVDYIPNQSEKDLARSVNRMLDVYKKTVLNKYYVYGS